MVRAILQFTLVLLLLTIVLTFESVVGLPVIFLTALGLLSVLLAELLWLPILLFIALSFVFAVVYQVPIVAAFVLLVGLVIFNTKGTVLVDRKAVRLLLSVLVGAGVVVAISPLRLSGLNVFTLLLQISIVVVLIWQTVGIPIITDTKVIKRLGRD